MQQRHRPSAESIGSGYEEGEMAARGSTTGEAPAPAAPGPQHLDGDDDDEDEDDESGRPVELKRYVRSLSQRSLGYFSMLSSTDFNYQHLDFPTPPEPPEPERPQSVASLLRESMSTSDIRTHSRASPTPSFHDRALPRNADSMAKLAFHRPFDTQLMHGFSQSSRFSSIRSSAENLLGPGSYGAGGLGPRKTTSGARIVGKAYVSTKHLDDASAVGPGSYNPVLSGLRPEFGADDHKMSSTFMGSTGFDPSHRVAEIMPDCGSYNPSWLPGLVKQPGTRGLSFGKPNGQGNAEKKSSLNPFESATSPAVGPGAYNPTLPAERSAPSAFLVARPPERPSQSRNLGPGAHAVPDRPPVTGAQGKLGAQRSFAARPYAGPMLDPEDKVKILARSKTFETLVHHQLTDDGRRDRQHQLNMSYLVRDERIAIASQVKAQQDAEIESRRRSIENKVEVRAEMKAKRHASLYRQLFFATIVMHGARASLLGERVAAARAHESQEKRRSWAAILIARFWRRSLGFAALRKRRMEVLSKSTIKTALNRYLVRTRQRVMDGAQKVLVEFMKEVRDSGHIAKAVRTAMYRIRVLQRAWRRLRARRAADLEMAMMQWDWFEPRRLAIGEKKRKKAEAGISLGGGVKFDVMGAGGGKAEDDLNRRGSTASPAGNLIGSTPRPKGIKRRDSVKSDQGNDGSSTPGRKGKRHDSQLSTSSGGDTPRHHAGETPRHGGETPRHSNKKRGNSGAGGATPRPDSGGGHTGAMTPRGDMSGIMTPRGLMTPRDAQTPRSRSRGKDKKSNDERRAHPMRGQVQGIIVLPEPIKRLKLRIWLKERERAHKARWRAYEARFAQVEADLRKQVEAKDIRNEAKILLGLEKSNFVTETELKKKVIMYSGPPPMRSPWLPERELNALIDEALSAHHFKSEPKKKKSSLSLSFESPAPTRMPSSSVGMGLSESK